MQTTDPLLTTILPVSSILFLAGSILLSVAAVITFGDDKLYAFDTGILGVVGVACWVIHVVVELIIDMIFLKRPWNHSRYGPMHSVNIVLSLLFGVAVILELYAILSSTKSFHLFDSGIWVISSALTCLGRGCDVKGENCNNAANIVFIIATSCMFLFAFLQGLIGGGYKLDCLRAFDVFFFVVSTMLFVIVGALYLMSDCLRRGIDDIVPSEQIPGLSSGEQRDHHDDVSPVMDIDYGDDLIMVDNVDFIENVIMVDSAYVEDENMSTEDAFRVENATPLI